MGARRVELRGRLGGLGLDGVRFGRLSPVPGGQGLRTWLDSGYYADMDWMERTAAKRMDPGLVPEGARPAVVLGGEYYQGEGPPWPARPPRWASYSLCRDHHASPVVRMHAIGVVMGMGEGACLAQARASESDASVLAEYESDPGRTVAR
jgi:hypothetical protein